MSEPSVNAGVQFNAGSGSINISGSAIGANASVANVGSTNWLAPHFAQLGRIVEEDAGNEQERRAGLAAVDWLRANATAGRAPDNADEHIGAIRRVSARAWQTLYGIATNATAGALAGWLTDLIVRH
jgi:hypothetical protein